MACVSGAIHVSTTTSGGSVLTVGYIRPGTWFGAAGAFEGATCSYDAYAKGPAVMLSVGVKDVRELLADYPVFYAAVMQLHARHIRRLFTRIEDLCSLRLRARLGKELLGLTKSFGVPADTGAESLRIGLDLSQEELGRLVGATRQRVNHELKKMEREGVIHVAAEGLIVHDCEALAAIGQLEPVGSKARTERKESRVFSAG